MARRGGEGEKFELKTSSTIELGSYYTSIILFLPALHFVRTHTHAHIYYIYIYIYIIVEGNIRSMIQEAVIENFELYSQVPLLSRGYCPFFFFCRAPWIIFLIH